MVYRDSYLPCSTCGKALEQVSVVGHDFARCPGCQGSLIPHDILACMLSDMTDGRRRFSPQPRPDEGPSRTCPGCGQAMEPVILLGVEADRCEAHGVWFDCSELQEVLRQAGLATRD